MFFLYEIQELTKTWHFLFMNKGIISLAKAAKIADLTIEDFLTSLTGSSAKCMDCSVDDLGAEMKIKL
jgi:predicted HTH domain antitoxin